MQLRKLVTQIADGRTTPVDLAEEMLARIERYDDHVNAYVRVDRPRVLEQAHLCKPEPRGRRTLHAVPLAIKDLLDIEGEVTSAASNVFANNVATRDAEVIRRLRECGAVFLGKTNLHEFAYGGSGIISNRGPARNPWDTTRITGGSSSGSAAAVAAGLCVAAVGTDTAGSIRLPASFCGIVGFKPTYGRISTDGVVPLSVSYDHVGPMTRSVDDARILFQAMSGEEAPFSVPGRKLRIGIPERYFYRDLESEVGKVMSSALAELEKAGHTLIEVDPPVEEDRTLVSFESYVYHAKWVDRSPELYQPETLRRILTGAKISQETAAQARAKLKTERATASDIFTSVDGLLTPTSPVLPARIEELLANPDTLRQRELVMLRNTRLFNVLGVPAISLPWDLAACGLPVGIQLAAAPGKDFELLAIAEEFEILAPWQGRTPPGFD
jgi:Asp-tRNA(Asn)/Glu-tRNA(Gln) amidotransferase A subunit family amidase